MQMTQTQSTSVWLRAKVTEILHRTSRPMTHEVGDEPQDGRRDGDDDDG